MGQKKLIRFAEIASFPNVLQYPTDMAGKWAAFFGNQHPLTLELACGKGEYAVGLGKLYPERNFLGVDLKGNRLWVGAKQATAAGLTNVGFLRTQIEKITDYFTVDEVSEIWITFPDPQLRYSRAKKRLTHPRFLRKYQQFLSPDGCIHLKTDSPDLYAFTRLVINHYGLALIEDNPNVHAKALLTPELSIRTHYESLDIAGSRQVYYLSFRIDRTLPETLDSSFQEQLIQAEQIKAGH